MKRRFGMARSTAIFLTLLFGFTLSAQEGGGPTSGDLTTLFSDGFESPAPAAGWTFGPILEWKFESGLEGWTVSDPMSGVGWDADAVPDLNAGSRTLNYNNDTNFNSGSRNYGTATSPEVDLSLISIPTLTFRCNYRTEMLGAAWDRRYVKIASKDGALTHLNEQVATTGGSPLAGACAAMGTWHQHAFKLQPSWGIVRIVFEFDTGDGAYNDGAGWFIGDVIVRPSIDWAIDSDFALGAFQSASSLNYNNGANYDVGRSYGGARSPAIDLAGSAQATLTFECNYQTETPGTLWDKRFVRIYSNGGADPVWSRQLATADDSAGAEAAVEASCAQMGIWHKHSIALDPSWGSVVVEFSFDSIDEVRNAFAGWAIDDVAVQGVAPVDVAGSAESEDGGGACGCLGMETVLLFGAWAAARRRRRRATSEGA